MKKALRKLTSFLMALFMVLQVMIPAFPSKAEEVNPFSIKGLEDVNVDEDVTLSITNAQKLYDRAKITKDEEKFSIALEVNKNTKSFRLVHRDDISLYDTSYFESKTEASKEFNRVKDLLNKQGLDIDISLIKDENGYRIVTEEEYQKQLQSKEIEKSYGEYYSYIDLKVLEDFDFSNETFNKFNDNENSLLFNLDFVNYTSPDPNFNLYQIDEQGNLDVKNEGDIIAFIRKDENDLSYAKLYDTSSLKEDFALLTKYKEANDNKTKSQENKEETKEENSNETSNEEKSSDENKDDDKKEESKEEKETSSNNKEESSNFDKANKDLKDALADSKNGIEEIQNLLYELAEKYSLNNDEIEKLMSENDKAINDLVKKDGEENFRPKVLAARDFEEKKYTIQTQLTFDNSQGPLLKTQRFFIYLDDKLTVKDSDTLLSLYDDEGNEVFKPTYDSVNNRIEYVPQINNYNKTYTFNINQQVSFSTNNIDANANSVKIDGILVSGIGVVGSGKKLPWVEIDKEGNIIATEQSPSGSSQYEVSYPYQLAYSSHQYANANEVIWDIEIDTSTINKDDLNYKKLYYTLYTGRYAGTERFKFKASSNKADLDNDSGYKTADSETEIFEGSEGVNKSSLGDKLYIRVKAPFDKSKESHSQYSMGLRVSPDENYVKNILDEFMAKYNAIPSPFKWIRGDKQALQYTNRGLNMIDTNLVANIGDQSYTLEQEQYFDSSRMIYFDRKSDTKNDWYALDQMRLPEDREDSALVSPNLNPNVNDVVTAYYLPRLNGGYRRVTNVNQAKDDDGNFFPGTIVSYAYKNQEGARETRYSLSTNLKEKAVDFAEATNKKLDGSDDYAKEGGQINVYNLKKSEAQVGSEYLMYYEAPFYIFRINKTFELVVCFNAGHEDPRTTISKQRSLQRVEDPSGDLLVNRLSGDGWEDAYRNLQPGGRYYRDGKTEQENLESAVKRAFYYIEEFKEEYKNKYGKEMHRQEEALLTQKVIHRITNDKPYEYNYLPAYNVIPEQWKFNRKTLWFGFKPGTADVNLDNAFIGDVSGTNLRDLKENEQEMGAIGNPFSNTENYAQQVGNRIESSYRNGDWNQTKENSVNLVFYDKGKEENVQNLITGVVYKPIEIDKISSDGKKIEGATFSFANAETGETTTWTSKTDNTDNKLYLKAGKYIVKETGVPDGYTEIEPFTIEVKRTEQNPEDGPFKYVGIDIHVNDGYKQELELTNVPKDAKGNPMVTQDGDKLKVEVKNEQANLGKINFIKINSRNKRLDGTEFTLTKINSKDDTTPKTRDDGELEYKMVSKGNNGSFEFKNMTEGFYLLEETNVPEGYEKAANQIIEAKLVRGDDGKEKIEAKFLDTTIENSKQIINKPLSTNIKFRKIDDANKNTEEEFLGLSGGRFRLIAEDTIDGSNYRKEARPSDVEVTKNESGVLTYKDGGFFEFDNIVIGTYLLEEIAAPKGYELPDNPFWRLVVELDKEDNSKLSYKLYKLHDDKDPEEVAIKDVLKGGKTQETFNITNSGRTLDTEFKKYIENPDFDSSKAESEQNKKFIPLEKSKLVDKDENPVKFALYESDFYGSKIEGQDPVAIVEADENGVFKLNKLKFQTYYRLEELNPPAGYQKAPYIILRVVAEFIASEGEMRLVVRDHNQNTLTGINNVFEGVIDYKEGEKLGKLTVKKTGESMWPQDAGKEVGLRRAYFRLYYADNNWNKIRDPLTGNQFIQRVSEGKALTDEDGNPIDPATLPPEQGLAVFDQLKPGKYILEEYRGPAGYEKDNTVWLVTVNADGSVEKREKGNLNTNTLRSSSMTELYERRVETSVFSTPSKAPRIENPSSYADITIKQLSRDDKAGTSQMEVTISPKSSIEPPAKMHAVFMVDRSLDQAEISNNDRNYSSIDRNVNKFINDFVNKAQEANAELTISIIQYSNDKNVTKVLANEVDPQTLQTIKTDFRNVQMATNPDRPDENKASIGETEEIYDYLKAAGISSRGKSGIVSVDDLTTLLTGNSYTAPNEGYDKKFVFNFTNSNVPNTSQYTKYSNALKTQFEDKGYETYTSHRITMAPDRIKDNAGYVKYNEYMQENGTNRTFELNGLGMSVDGNNGFNYGLYVEKATLDNYLLDGNFTSGESELAINNANFNIDINDKLEVKDANWKVTVNGRDYSQNVEKTTSGLKITNLTLQNNQSLRIVYDVRTKDDTESGTYKINKNMFIKSNAHSEGATITDTFDVTKTKQGSLGLKLNFFYNDDGTNERPAEGSQIGQYVLQRKYKNAYWGDGAQHTATFNSPLDGSVDLATLASDLVPLDIDTFDYRIVYELNQDLANKWGVQRLQTYEITSDTEDIFTDANGNKYVKVDIMHGNMLRVFNKNETGFRIPLRIAKVTEDGSQLEGASFKVRKITYGDQILDGQRPKYWDEDYDQVSAATGLAGDYYFRELTPGIYEMTEEQLPSSNFQWPVDSNGNKMKWYFKVYINEDKKPGDAGYMSIDFNFTHLFTSNDKFAEGIKASDYLGKTIQGMQPIYDTKGELTNVDFAKYVEKIIEDDKKSQPARPDAPYKSIFEATLVNYKGLTSLEFEKKDDSANSRLLQGAKFRLTKVKANPDGTLQKDGQDKPIVDKYEEDNPDFGEVAGEIIYQKEITSNSIGAVKFDGISAGYYILEEIEAPQGYDKMPGYTVIRFYPNKDGDWVQEAEPNEYVELTEKQELNTVINKQSLIDFEFTKLNENLQEVSVSSFKLEKIDNDGNLVIDEKTKRASYSQEISHAFTGDYKFENLTEGKYRLTETNSTVYDKPIPWYFDVVKDENTGKLKIVFDENQDKSIRFSQDENGNPTNIQVINYSRTNFRFTKLGKNNEELKGAKFSLKKVKISKAEVSRIDYNNNNQAIGMFKDYGYYDEITTFDYGIVDFRNLGEGVYELTELVQPAGYQNANGKDRWIISVEKSKDDGLEVKYDKKYEEEYYKQYESDFYNQRYVNFEKGNVLTLDATNGNTLTNDKNVTDFKFNKVDAEGNKILRDTRFDLYKLGNNPSQLDPLPTTYITGWQSIAREEDGVFEFSDLDRGIYYLTEVIAPEGYNKTERDFIVQVIEENENSKKFVTNIYEVERKDGKVNLIKNEADFRYIDKSNGEVNIKNDDKAHFFVSKGRKNILGNFGHINSGKLSLKLQPHDDLQLPAGKIKDDYTITYTYNLSKDTNRYKVYFEDLIDGKYVLTEEVAPEGYQKTNRSYVININTENKEARLLYVLDENGKKVVNENSELLADDGTIIPADGLLIESTDGKQSNFKIVNKELEIEFEKVDEDNPSTKLGGVQFYLQKYSDETGKFEYLDENGNFVSDDNPTDPIILTSESDGKIKIKNPKVGDYQLIEIKAPDGYKEVQGPVKSFIITDKGEIITGGEYLSEDNNKITNEKIVEISGEFEIVKTDAENRPLEGAIFELTNSDGEVIRDSITSGADGKVTVKNLEPGSYILRESKAPDGYKKTGKTWNVLVKNNGQTFVTEIGETIEIDDSEAKDVGDLLEFTGDISYTDENGNRALDVATNENNISINMHFKANGQINPGDYFTLEESDTLHYNMLQNDKFSYPSIFMGDKVLAYPTFNKDFNVEKGTNKKITYIFTDTVSGLENVEMDLVYTHSVNVNAASDNGLYGFSMKLKNQIISDRFDIIHGQLYEKDELNMKSAYLYTNDQNGNYTQLGYINPLKKNISKETKIYVYPLVNSNYSNMANISQEDTSIELYRFKNGAKIPDAVVYEKDKLELVDPSEYTLKYVTYSGVVNAEIEFKNGIGNSAYFIKVDSMMKLPEDTSKTKILGQIIRTDIGYNTGGEDYKKLLVANTILNQYQGGAGTGEYTPPSIDVENEKYENQVTIKKVDEQGNVLQGAEFTLFDKNTNKAVLFEGQEIKAISGEDGLAIFKDIKPGTYYIKETKAPDDYILVDKQFDVSVNADATIVEAGDNNKYNLSYTLENKKQNANIYFKKVDGRDTNIAIKDAKFILYKEDNGEFKPVDKDGNIVEKDKAYTVTSDTDGKFQFENLKDGSYEVYEDFAPDDYIKPTKAVYKFKVEKGKVYKDGQTAELENSDTNREEIKNYKASYPQTGGPGVWIGYTIIGLILMTMASLIYNKKRQQSR